MELTNKKIIWGILLFGTLIGLNETIVGSIHIQYKSVILSTITLALFAFARHLIPCIGTSILIMLIAVIFKLTSLGLYFCRPTMVIMLGIGFEVFASVFIRKDNFRYYRYILTCALSSLIVFISFALFERHAIKNGYWISNKFNDYVFVKGPITALTSALLCALGLLIIKQQNLNLNNLLIKNPVLSQIILGLFIVSLWTIGIVSGN